MDRVGFAVRFAREARLSTSAPILRGASPSLPATLRPGATGDHADVAISRKECADIARFDVRANRMGRSALSGWRADHRGTG
jgi:hypothetical protein